MFNERAFISRVERANPEELANILIRPTLEEERALRVHLGDERYQRMHSMALKRKVSRSVTAKPKGNVIVIHGIMGAELSVGAGGSGDLTWVNAFRILRGWLDRLRLSDDGRSEANSKYTVTASGIMKRYYGEMLLALAENWNVKDFYFDWRKDLELAADSLNERLSSWFDDKAPVHIVAHSMGGLVARTFTKKYKSRWGAMWDKQGNGKAGGRLIMLGTPNQGSFAIPQVITGLEGLVRKLALLDLRHNISELLETFNSFVGSYQMLPSPDEMSNIKNLYTAGTYSKFNVTVPQQHLTRALAHHQWLKDAVDIDRMVYVAGYDQPTYSDISDWDSLDKTRGYQMTLDGDGRVTHRLGLLKQVRTYYIKEDHGNLSTNTTILAALDGLLETGTTSAFPESLPARRAAKPSQDQLRAEYEAKQRNDELALSTALGRMSSRSVPLAARNGEEHSEENGVERLDSTVVSPEERKVEEAITRGFLSYRGAGTASDVSTDNDSEPGVEAQIEIGLAYGGIESVDYEKLRSKNNHAVDAVAVGHYIGVQPQWAELALDRAISAALLPKGTKGVPTQSDLILTQYTERGIIHGKLGQPFLMPDPRVANSNNGRLIAIAGMNEPGRFGVPELTVLARELCWALGRLNKTHLATVMIGSGDGNIPLRNAVAAWLTGIRRAVAGSKFDEGRRLQRVTFVEYNPDKVIQLDKILTRERDKQQNFEIIYDSLTDIEKNKLMAAAYQRAKEHLEAKWKRNLNETRAEPDAVPSRVTLSLDPDKNTYRFGAITADASIPERDTVIDPNLVWTANTELAGEQIPEVQLERGQFLEGLLMPPDLRKELYGAAPLVMMLDATTARIHWEMVAQPSLDLSPLRRPTARTGKFEYADGFLGTSRGFTRQLRTTFAPPPEPPPPPQSVLRVLIVADPAEDAHLPGAEEEAVAVADLFEGYGSTQQASNATRVEVKRLFGPIDATRTNVLRELMLRPYDILHFAGHCVYEWDGNPNLSGWIFNAKRKELLSANELNRIDRIPKFVFSNACESGITPDRAQARNDRLAPSFAEAFFNRGVANFVCTAWPVDDVAARVFAVTLYSHLLGIQTSSNGGPPSGPVPMHEAMRQARLTIADTPNGRTTWGAYQHYGNPYFRLFYERADSRARNVSRTSQNGGKPTKKTRSTKAKKTTKSRKRS